MAVAAAVFGLAVWRYWQSDGPALPIVSSYGDVMLVHKCARMHVSRLYGQLEPPICPVAGCNNRTYPQENYRCSNGHTFEVAVQVSMDEDGIVKAARLRLPGKEWVSVDKTLRCPTCNAPLHRVPMDPLQPTHRKHGE